MTKTLRQKMRDLPHEVTSFVGRREATAEVRRALSESRLVTLVGVGGVGKSRLATHVAAAVRKAFPDGVWLVELATVKDPALVPRAVAATLGVLDQSTRSPEAVLVDYLADKRSLLLFDNCEHVLEACAQLVSALLSATSELRVLATSREPLGIAAEQVWVVSPLSVPVVADHGSVDAPQARPWHEYEAVTLFADRAASVAPEFALSPYNEAAVVRLCQRLDGLPLALELAAVRVRALSVHQILSRLENRFLLLTSGNRAALPRHQTLRAAVDWSFDLCTEPEQILWARCSVFAGEFDLDAAESVCSGAGLAEANVLTAVSGLVDKSVLVSKESGPRVRYQILESIRAYGAERLAATGETAEVRRRHRDYYLRLAQRADAESCGPRQAEWGARLRAERANLWAALDYCVTTPGEARAGLRLGTALWFYWNVCGFVRDGRHWMERVLALDPEPGPERARALWLTAWLAYLQGDTACSRGLLGECADLARQFGNDAMLACATHWAGVTEVFGRDPAKAVPLLDEALVRYRRSDAWTAPALLIFAHRAQVACLLKDLERAVALHGECAAICTALGESWALSWSEWHLGIALWDAGDFPAATAHLRASLSRKRAVDDRVGIWFCVEVLAWVAVSAGDERRAAVLFGAEHKMWQLIGRPLFGSPVLLGWSERSKERCRAVLGDRTFDASYRRGAELPPEEIISYALDERVGPPDASAEAPSARRESVLTKREREVAALIAAGKSNKEIATSLVVSTRTAESHVEHILAKLGFSSRTQVAAWRADQERQQ